jgi:hypothetical protein
VILLDLLGLLEPAALGVSLVILGHLSRRLGKYTHDKPFFRWLYAAAGLMWLSLLGRFGLIVAGAAFPVREVAEVIIYAGLPALTMTISLWALWRYWSWLLAERG